MKKKYCIFIPSLGGGGAEKVVALLANFLSKKENTEVFLVVLRSEGVYWEFIDKKVKIVNLNQNRVLKGILPLSNWIRLNKPDVVFSALSHVNVAVTLAKNISRHPCNLIISEHSTISDALILNKKLYKFIFSFFYSQADHIVAVSKGVKDDLSKTLNINPNKIIVINNPVYPSVKTELRINFNNFFKNKKDKVILSIGRLEKEKNYINLLKAFKNLENDNLGLVILGEGKERKLLETYIIDNKLTDRVILPGFVKDPFVWINSCDLFVSSSEREGFGNAIVEAMAYGLNIVSTDCVGPREILQDGRFGVLVPRNDPKALSEEIHNLLSNPNRFNKEDILNRSRDFSESVIFKSYEKVM